MARPVTLFTGQWADLTLEELAAKCGDWGFDGLELACWGDHFDVAEALADAGYCAGRARAPRAPRARRAGRSATTSSARRSATRSTRATRPCCRRTCGATATPRACAGGRPRSMKDTARAAAQLGVEVVTGFTGSSIWHMLYSFPPNDFDEIERGYEDFAERWGPIIDVFDAEGVQFALEVHPTEIAYDFVTTRKTLDAIGNREGFGINFDPSHFEHQFLDSRAFVDRVRRPHLPRARQGLDQAPRRAPLDPRRRT